MIIQASSWHYRLLRAFEVTITGIDSCTYRRKLLVLLSFVTAAAAFVLYAVGDFIGWVLGCITSTCAEPTFGAVVVIMSLGIATFVCCVAGAINLREKWRGTHPIDPDAPPSFVKQAYRQWRDKYCTKVEIHY
jgi:hypothetical protein